ncbi:LuxR C-terminal-related transcriptional regulator [Brenneria populi]|uniref:LuxR C-terminal-related transcriptional regulator n=1 Tax=Brenneria populi TaxID=1505588 RepID=A0ABU6JTN0_9GAMM|nr:LuxR C-terminal-related transcriptional regulator [Brenneria populi Li et al. 2015]
MLLYTDNNFIGYSIYNYLISMNKKVNCLCFSKLNIIQPSNIGRLIFLNTISKNISSAEAISLLNKNRSLLSHSTVVLIVRSEISNICSELIRLDNPLILTEKSSLAEFAAVINKYRSYIDSYAPRINKKLTMRERQVLELIVAKYSGKKIAHALNIEYKTVHSHKMNILNKLRIHNSMELNKTIVKIIN